MKKTIASLLIGFVLGISTFGYAEEISQWLVEKANFPILVNGKLFQTDKPIVTINGSTYLPLKAIGDALGIRVAWNSNLQRAEIGDQAFYNENSYSYSKPAPIGVPQVVSVDDIITKYSAEVVVKEVLRGNAAWEMIKNANMFNQPPKEGYEYLLTKISFKLLDINDGKTLNLNGKADFKLISSTGKEYEYANGVNPEPSLDATLYKGASNEGWVFFLVKKDDLTPKITFGRKYDGSGGIWFKAYNE